MRHHYGASGYVQNAAKRDALANAIVDIELARKKLSRFGHLGNDHSDRHGDLQVVLSAVRRVEASVQVLIAEENSK